MNYTLRITSLMTLLLIGITHMHAIDYRILDHDQLAPYAQTINLQRVAFYSEYPYLFVCENAPEDEYFQVYLESSQTLMVGAFDEQELVGFIIGMPLKDYNVLPCGAREGELILARDTFKDIPVSFDDCYYMSEMCVVRDGYDRDAIANELFKRFEKAVQTHTTGYGYLCMMILELLQNHPMRPIDPVQRWVEREGVHLANNGYTHTDYTIVYEWPTLQQDGTVKMQKNPMNFWYKTIAARE